MAPRFSIALPWAGSRRRPSAKIALGATFADGGWRVNVAAALRDADFARRSAGCSADRATECRCHIHVDATKLATKRGRLSRRNSQTHVRPGLRLAAGLLVWLAGSVAGAAWDSWHAAPAPARLRLARESGLATTVWLRADLPTALRPTTGAVAAFAANGQPLATAPVLVDGQLVAAEIQLPGNYPGGPNQPGQADDSGFPDRSPVFLYLFEAGVNVPAAAGNRQPISLYGKTEKSITRPNGCPDLLLYSARQGILPFRQDTNLFGQHGGDGDATREAGRLRGRRTRSRGDTVIRSHFATTVRLEQPATVRFGVRDTDCAWFIFVDGRGVGAWKDVADQQQDAMLGLPQSLAAGLHSFDLIVLRRTDEPPAMPVWQLAPGGTVEDLPVAALAAARFASAQRLEFRDGANHPGWQLELQTFLLPHHPQPLRTVAIRDLSLVDGQAPPTFAIGDEPPGPASLRVFFADAMPAVRLFWPVLPGPLNIALPAFPATHLAVARPSVYLDELPVTLPADRGLRLSTHLDGWPTAWQGLPGLSVSLQALADDGSAVELHRQPVDLAAASSRPVLAAAIPGGIRRLQVRGHLGGQEVAPGVDLRLLRPADDLSGLQGVADRLTVDGQAAVLCPEPMPEGPYKLAKGWPLGQQPRLLWVDEYWATGSGPDGTLAIAACLAERTGFRVTRVAVDRRAATATLPELHAFELAAAALTAQPDVIVWTIGARDLEAGLHRDERLRRLLFLVQASLARGILPVIVTVPPLPDIDVEEGRASALAAKRLALRLGVPVCDLYSAALALPTRVSLPFASLKTAAGGTVALAGGNDAGRQWFCEQLALTLATIHNR